MIAQFIRLVTASAQAAHVKKWLPQNLTNAVRKALLLRSVATFPDRRFLEDVILPSLQQRKYKKVLFVGCEPYTQWYEKFFADSEYWTTDIKKEAAAWGGSNHIVADITRIREFFPQSTFDLVLLNGVYGFGVDKVGPMTQGFDSVLQILKPEGDLLLGWNTDLVEVDPQSLAQERGFTVASDLGFDSRVDFEKMKHSFATLRKPA